MRSMQKDEPDLKHVYSILSKLVSDCVPSLTFSGK